MAGGSSADRRRPLALARPPPPGAAPSDDDRRRLLGAEAPVPRSAAPRRRRAFRLPRSRRRDRARRASHREGHYMGADMVASQFDALEPPDADETDVVDRRWRRGTSTTSSPRRSAARHGGARHRRPRRCSPTAAPIAAITADELAAHIASLVRDHVLAAGARRVLLVPPDHTRLHSRSGPITVMLKRELEHTACTVGVLPALGTHVAMTERRRGGDVRRRDRCRRPARPRLAARAEGARRDRRRRGGDRDRRAVTPSRSRSPSTPSCSTGGTW